MKVVIVHDWLVIDGGAEKVLRAILDIYPNADIFSLVDFLNDRDRGIIQIKSKSYATKDNFNAIFDAVYHDSDEVIIPFDGDRGLVICDA